jgi:HD-GYP domain-containing protein (c-di-GMP phosphodiesterase class II)
MKGCIMKIGTRFNTNTNANTVDERGNKAKDGTAAELGGPYWDLTAPLSFRIPVDTSILKELVAFSGVTRALLETIEAKDPSTRGHCDRVASLSRRLAMAAGCDDQLIDEATVCGWLHDVGKIGVPDHILQKTGPLTDEEFTVVQRHSITGERILGSLPQIDAIRDGVRSHHERWDGRGYPDGLAGDAIPLIGRIVAVADAFDAMCSKRAYRDGMPAPQACAEIAACAGTQLDPFLVACFLEMNPMEHTTSTRISSPETSLRHSA